MDKFPKELVEEVGLKLPPADLIRLCSTSTQYNRLLCNSNSFWLRKLRYDYPDEMQKVGDVPIPNPKNIYMRRFIYVTEKIEAFMNKFIEIIWGYFSQYLNEKFKKNLYQALYKIYKIVNDEFTEEDEIDQDAMGNIWDNFMFEFYRNSRFEDEYGNINIYKVKLFEDFRHTPKVYDLI